MAVYWNLSRLFNGKRVLQSSKCFEANLPSFVRCRSDNSTVRIADISKEIKPARRPEYVPRKYFLKADSQESLRHLKWMLQKDLLSQDIFLVGAPGTRRRELALAYLELTERELEFIALSRDTTEADLKQRREIRGGTAYYHDQSAVRAATNGRVLIIEGVEKAERNVLPVLNNLLENREMHLEDGRFLIPATRYDKLLELHSQEELDSWNLVRVSEDFRVIALGLPSPRYPGHPLDPPLRSRFQARHIPPPSFQEQLNHLKRIALNVDDGRLSQLLSCAHALVTDEAVSLGLPDFPLDNLEAAAVIMENSPQVEAYDLFCRFYPYKLFLGKEGRAAVESILDTFNVLPPSSYNAVSAQEQIKVLEKIDDRAQVLVENGRTRTLLNLCCGSKSGNEVQTKGYVETKYQNQLLSEMLRSHLVSDFCLIGPKGCGKSVTVQNFADLLGYQLEPVVLYQDMTSRDLIQQRTTLSNGDTVWRESPLVEAALQGKLAVLDGVNRIHPSTLAILHRLVHDRELQLHDGKRLVSADRYDEMKNMLGKSDQEMTDSGILRISPSFRIVALAEPPVINSSSGQWLNSELLSLFLFHEMRPLEKSEELHIIRSKFGEPSKPLLRIIDLAHTLRSSKDPTLQSLAGSLSTRQLLRIAERMQKFQTENAYQAVQRATLAKFLPAVARQALDDCCKRLEIFPGTNSDDYRSMSNVSCSITEDQVRIGETTVPRFKTSALSKVPDILFYDVPQHLCLLEHLLQDFSLGHNLLLVGNQGVGKNKIADRLLQLLNRPREYIQLHRDTTVQTLTIQPMVRDGRVVYEDSPLVQAVKLGHVLVVDEADKAPTHVTCILKTLIESGEMILSDGRRIVPFLDKPDPERILLHPDFRMIVLANRPGFPFLGNDFFGALGDLFSCHAVDNPSFENEIQLLKRYGPSVDAVVIQKLVKAFGELRAMADQGLVSYPYSTREVVNVVKHLEKFPNEPLASVVRNVFDFDRHSQEVYDTLVNVLHKHGIPLGTRGTSVLLAREISLPETKVSGSWRMLTESRRQLPVEERYVKLRDPRQLEARTKPLDLVEARSALFTELQRYWTISFSESGVVAGLTATRGVKGDGTDDRVHVLTTSPLTLHTGCQGSEELQEVSIHGLLSPERGQRPFYSLAPYQGHQIVVHEETSNSVLLIDTNEATARSVQLSSFLDQATDKISNAFRSRIPRWTMKSDLLSLTNQLVFFVQNSNRIEVLDFTKMTVYSITLPFEVQSLLLSKDKWLIQDSSRNKHILRKSNDLNPCPDVLEDLEESTDQILKRGSLQTCSKDSLHKDLVSEAIQQRIDAPNRLFATDNVYAAIAIGFPDLDSPCEVHCWPRRSRVHSLGEPILMENGQIIRTVTKQEAFEILESDERQPGLAGYLEVVDTARRKLRYIPVPEPVNVSPVTQWIYPKELPVYISKMSDDNLVTVDASGCVRFWESSITSVERSLDGWRRMLEDGEERAQQVTKERHSGLDVSGPKRGQVDPDNQPHVGGNTWAGGTGGRDTAGLGGKGGPYRLDAGHTVHQLSDQEKNAVPEDIKRAAREMGQRAFQNRLKEIRMSEYDHSLYAKFSNAVQGQVQALRVILGSLQAKSNERQWCRHQTSGELDDTKLIEGLTGERTIYRRRAEREPEIGAPPLKPKRLRLVVDVSGSMYRFNGYDGRLDRELEACVMVMEAFHGYEGKFRYDVVGHSGDDYRIRFVDQAQPPGDNKKRLEVIKTMHAHSQFCMSGDHTLEATQDAINALAKEDTDESIVVVLSDANLERYGIPAQRFARILTSNPDVNAYAIFIGSLGDQAARLIKQMPSGRAFVCMDLKDIPRILQQIFAASVLSTTKSS